MELVENKDVDIIMPVIGGYNTASLLAYIDLEKIEKSQKIFCGYSDVTSIHLAILSKTKLPTIYGVAVVPTFGEYLNPLIYSEEDFKRCLKEESYELFPPKKWSNQLMDAFSDEWKKSREYQENSGWTILNKGKRIGEVLVFNINTLVSLLGSDFIPDFSKKILILEEMDATITLEERNLNSLKLAGVFNSISGLIFSKPEKFDDKKSGKIYEDLIREIVGERNYPIIINFDCGHTIPSMCIPQKSLVLLDADLHVKVKILKNSIFELINGTLIKEV